MRMVRCYECGKQYDYDDDGFCPKCGSFNQPERPPAAGSVRAAERPALSAAGKRRGGSGLQQELGESPEAGGTGHGPAAEKRVSAQGAAPFRRPAEKQMTARPSGRGGGIPAGGIMRNFCRS